MKVLRRDPAAAAHRRARAVAALGAMMAAGTAGLMALAMGTAVAADQPAGSGWAEPTILPPPGRTAAATTVFRPVQPVVGSGGAVPSGPGRPMSEGTPSTTPSADPTPGS
jgi:hypothetical protein